MYTGGVIKCCKISFFSNQVKGDGKTERATHARVKREEVACSSKMAVKRESLLKPNFRKPSATTVVQKKSVVSAPAGESRRGRGRKPAAKQTSPNTQTITHSRLNLLKALSKVKTDQVDNKEELVKFYSERCRATLAEGGEDETSIKYFRSDEDCSDKSSSYDGMEVDPLKIGRKRRSPALHSEDSSDGDYMKHYPALPNEPPPKTEFTQEEFLGIFKLITPQVAEKLKLRRSERKRRNCTKNEKNDFHYGNFDLNEVSWILVRFDLCCTIFFIFSGRLQGSTKQ